MDEHLKACVEEGCTLIDGCAGLELQETSLDQSGQEAIRLGAASLNRAINCRQIMALQDYTLVFGKELATHLCRFEVGRTIPAPQLCETDEEGDPHRILYGHRIYNEMLIADENLGGAFWL